MESKGVVGTSKGATDLSKAFSHAEIIEENHVGDGANRIKAKKRKKIITCKFCGLVFEKGQALGGHMNKHLEARKLEKIARCREILEIHDNQGQLNAVNPRNLQPMQLQMQTMMPIQSTSFFQRPLQQLVESSQELLVDSQQCMWPQTATYELNAEGGPTNDFTTFAPVIGNYGPQSVDPSMLALLPYSAPVSNFMTYSQINCGNYVHDPYCVPSSSRTYQDPQMNMHIQQEIFNHQALLGPPNVRMDNSVHAQDAGALTSSFLDPCNSQGMAVPQGSPLVENLVSSVLDLGSQEMAGPQGAKIGSEDASHDANSEVNDSFFAEWRGNPVTDNCFSQEPAESGFVL